MKLVMVQHLNGIEFGVVPIVEYGDYGIDFSSLIAQALVAACMRGISIGCAKCEKKLKGILELLEEKSVVNLSLASRVIDDLDSAVKVFVQRKVEPNPDATLRLLAWCSSKGEIRQVHTMDLGEIDSSLKRIKLEEKLLGMYVKKGDEWYKFGYGLMESVNSVLDVEVMPVRIVSIPLPDCLREIVEGCYLFRSSFFNCRGDLVQRRMVKGVESSTIGRIVQSVGVIYRGEGKVRFLEENGIPYWIAPLIAECVIRGNGDRLQRSRDFMEWVQAKLPQGWEGSSVGVGIRVDIARGINGMYPVEFIDIGFCEA